MATVIIIIIIIAKVNNNNDKQEQFLLQRLFAVLQRFNAILLYKSFGSDVDPDLQPTSFFLKLA